MLDTLLYAIGIWVRVSQQGGKKADWRILGILEPVRIPVVHFYSLGI